MKNFIIAALLSFVWLGRAKVGDLCPQYFSPGPLNYKAFGYCHDLNKSPCKGRTTHGDCPNDPNNVKCCMEITRCYDNQPSTHCSWPSGCWESDESQLSGMLRMGSQEHRKRANVEKGTAQDRMTSSAASPTDFLVSRSDGRWRGSFCPAGTGAKIKSKTDYLPDSGIQYAIFDWLPSVAR
jgi:hypothetical protein